MVNMDKITKKYYIKKNGIVNEVTEDEYKIFKEQMEKLKKFYLCPHCKVCTCDKIKYSDIKVCEEVNDAAYELLKGVYKNKLNGKNTKKTEVEEFEVYDCDKFELYSNLVIEDNIVRAKTQEEKNDEELNQGQSLKNKLEENKKILEDLRNKVKEENQMKLVNEMAHI